MASPYGPGPQGGWPQQPGPAQYPPTGYRPPAGPRRDNDRGFFGSLFDFTFDNFVSPKLIKFLYVLSMIGATLAALLFLVSGFVMLSEEDAAPAGLLMIIASPFLWLIWLIVIRVYLELIIVMFKISEDIKDIRDSSGVR